jgi:hypothetical protein
MAGFRSNRGIADIVKILEDWEAVNEDRSKTAASR